ncbi:aminotransferase class I/II-fold pyridoxal phosphate-dependent enzyme [Planococcus versutus]|uniref:Aminotransferase n=1 Tax=Planococcus versutus TaxID=1302659 RepID=A0A1B1S3B1_9BACL|nr:aminotransferase class I/II-fold pyridoxal phosphate-dependent enzyme [Planococcus versutus]ANU27697.1 N-acetyl-L,L-diaminopimelate aminotransferase [Planococcus versutus]
MSISINHRVETIQISGIRQFSNQLVDYPNAINLTIGQPDFPTPEAIKRAAITAIENNRTNYSHNAGLLELRTEIASFFQDTYRLTFDPKTEIIVTNGASEGLDSLLRVILEEGDEVILPVPTYPGYEPIIKLCGAKVVYLDMSDTGFQPDPARLESLITERTKAVMMNFPSNPTGVTMDSIQLENVAAVLEKYEVFVVTDEIYSENSYRGKHVTFAHFEKMRNRTFLVHGLSKSHSMTGWRIGFVLGPEIYMKHVLKVHQYNAICASVPSQYAAIEAVKNQRHIPGEMNKEYMRRRDFVYSRLTVMGMNVILPTGAFYIFPSIEKFGMTSFEFATRLLKEGDVAAVPGSAFTRYGEGFIRISYACSMNELEEGMKRLEKFIATLT